MTTSYSFIEPLDVLFLRGNRLFGGPGSHAASLVPPWPSVAAGALRSLLLAESDIDIAAFARSAQSHPTLGTPQNPGSFMLRTFDLARRDRENQVQTLHALPADLVLTEDSAGQRKLKRLQPQAPAAGLASSAPFALWPVLAESDRSKPVGGHWLTQAGWAAYLAGCTPAIDELVPSAQLWQIDTRAGVGLNAATRHAEDGKLFTTQAVAFVAGVGFLAGLGGARARSRGVLRFGGDGRGAILSTVEHAAPQPDFDAIARSRRCRIVLTTPALFARGWLPSGVDAEMRFGLQGVVGRLVCAAVPRAEVVSGWDLAKGRPKPAERAAPGGSVYWLDDVDAAPGQLRKLAEHGLWDDSQHNAARRAEGFNRFTFAAD